MGCSASREKIITQSVEHILLNYTTASQIKEAFLQSLTKCSKDEGIKHYE